MSAEPEAGDARRRAGSSRRRGREVALQVLYAIDLASDRTGRPPVEPDTNERQGDVPPPELLVAPAPDEVFDAVASNFEMPPGASEFAHDLVERVRAHGAELDRVIGEHARNWRLSRMAAVDRNILRLATFELMHTETPDAVILNEAVDLARRFGSDPSPAFVNGILDAVARVVRQSRV